MSDRVCNMSRAAAVILLSLLVSSCASLQTHMGNASLDSYLQGCIYRGVDQGIERDKATALCECHVNKAIEQSSQKEFLDSASRLANASREERQSDALAKESALVKDSFKECKASMGIQ